MAESDQQSTSLKAFSSQPSQPTDMSRSSDAEQQQSTSSQVSSSQPSETTDMSRSSNAGQDPASSPPLFTSNAQCSGKPKKRPTVTPRTFTRFFTPRSSLGRGKKIGASRQALREITASASNRRRLPQRRSLTRDTVQLFEDENDDVEGTSKKRKRKTRALPHDITGQSSPLKRLRHQSLDTLDNAEDGATDSDIGLTDDESGTETGDHRRIPRVIDPIKSRLGGPLAWSLRRETGRIDRPRLAQDASYGAGTSAPTTLADCMNNINRLAE